MKYYIIDVGNTTYDIAVNHNSDLDLYEQIIVHERIISSERLARIIRTLISSLQ